MKAKINSEIQKFEDISVLFNKNFQYNESVDSTDSIIHYVRAHRSLEVKTLVLQKQDLKKLLN